MTREQAIDIIKCLAWHRRPEEEEIEQAIETLKQEPSEDCVSRQETLDTIIKELCIKDESYLLQSEKAIYNVVKNMPSVTPTQRWIPVSERLPEVGEKVLCQCQANIYEVLKLTVDGWYHDNNHCYMSGFVIAWQPLPQPYKEK